MGSKGVITSKSESGLHHRGAIGVNCAGTRESESACCMSRSKTESGLRFEDIHYHLLYAEGWKQINSFLNESLDVKEKIAAPKRHSFRLAAFWQQYTSLSYTSKRIVVRDK